MPSLPRISEFSPGIFVSFFLRPWGPGLVETGFAGLSVSGFQGSAAGGPYCPAEETEVAV